MARIGLFTGTFDPVHTGHIQVAVAALQRASLNEVWFLVNPDPGHKLAVAGYEHRLAMVGEALSGRQQLRLAPHNSETPAVHTIAYFAAFMERFPQHTFDFVVGSDAFLQLPSWKSVESVVKNTSYIVIQRSAPPHNTVEEVRVRLGILGSALKARQIILPELLPASSTDIRYRLGRAQQPKWLNPEVRAYIARNGLYAPPN